jgi:uncharacterized protein YicC (UPF0701 family)
MTGFGRASLEGPIGQVSVEVKSVNHRFLKLQFRIAPMLERLETEIENRVRARLTRGAVNVTVDMKLKEPPAPQQLEPAVAVAHLKRLRALWAAVFPDAPTPEPARLFEMLIRLPPPPPVSFPTQPSEMEQIALAAVDQALAVLEESREAEGRDTAAALTSHRQNLARMRDAIAGKAPQAIRAAQARFVERLNQILEAARPGLTLDAEAVLRESAVYAERGDISEELTRLGGHLTRFDEILAAPSEVGRRLEFLLQEMLREANTVGSKSLDLGISHDVVEVKAEIEKMKEQVLNLE